MDKHKPGPFPPSLSALLLRFTAEKEKMHSSQKIEASGIEKNVIERQETDILKELLILFDFQQTNVLLVEEYIMD